MGFGGGHVIPKGIVVGPSIYAGSKGYLKFCLDFFGGKGALDGDQLPFSLFSHLKWTSELFISVRMSSLPIL